MAKRKLISLCIKLLIVALAIGFIYQRLFATDDMVPVRESIFSIDRSEGLLYFIVALLLMPLNWGIETVKWSFLIRKIEPVGFWFALRAIFCGVTTSIFTPNRIGEYAGRVFFLRKADVLEASLVTILGSFAQLLVTLATGGISLIFFIRYYYEHESNPYLTYAVGFLAIGVLVLSIAAFLNSGVLTILLKRIKPLQRFNRYVEVFSYYSSAELFRVLLYSLGRYIIFSLQFYLLLEAFQVHISTTEALVLLPMTFLSITAIPSLFVGELLVRESIALSMIGLVSENDLGIITASFALWMINLAIPALIGSVFIFGVRIFRKIIHYL